MKKLMILLIALTSFKSTNTLAQVWDITEFKTCLFHEVQYSIRLSHLPCPLNINNPPPQDNPYPDSDKDTIIFIPPNKTVIVHSPECYGEGPHPQ